MQDNPTNPSSTCGCTDSLELAAVTSSPEPPDTDSENCNFNSRRSRRDSFSKRAAESWVNLQRALTTFSIPPLAAVTATTTTTTITAGTATTVTTGDDLDHGVPPPSDGGHCGGSSGSSYDDAPPMNILPSIPRSLGEPFRLKHSRSAPATPLGHSRVASIDSQLQVYRPASFHHASATNLTIASYPSAALRRCRRRDDDEVCFTCLRNYVLAISRLRLVHSQITSLSFFRERTTPCPHMSSSFSTTTSTTSTLYKGKVPLTVPATPALGSLPSLSAYALQMFPLRMCFLPQSLVDSIPSALREGTPLLKTTRHKAHYRSFRLDASLQRIIWDSRKKGRIAYIDLESIIDIYSGPNAESVALNTKHVPDTLYPYIFVISYYDCGDILSLNLVADNQLILDEWLATLQKFLATRRPVYSPGEIDEWRHLCARRMWWHHQDMILKLTPSVSESEAPGYFQQPIDDAATAVASGSNTPTIGVYSSSYGLPVAPHSYVTNQRRQLGLPRKLERILGNSVATASGPEDFSLFSSYIRAQMVAHPPLDPFHRHCANPATGMTLCEFESFIRDCQRERVDSQVIKQWFRQFSSPNSNILSLQGFSAFLQSPLNMLSGVSPSDSSPLHDMTFPLNDYYIASSHNTYIMSDQLLGTSSTQGYIRALLRGCRCVELDCWDGSYGEPVICHGVTFTTRVLFRDVVAIIQHYAFVTSPYPVILSLENHCSLSQQRRIAAILIEVLGEHLVTSPLESSDSDKLPSPKDLMYRFIIKNKVRSKDIDHPDVLGGIGDLFSGEGGNAQDNSNSVGGAGSESHTGSSNDNAPLEPAAAVVALPPPLSAFQTFGSTSSSSRGSVVFQRSVKGSHGSNKVAQELSDIIVYCQSVHFAGFNPPVPYCYNQIISVDESKSKSCIEDSRERYIEFNMDSMSRVYPGSIRVTSSNFDPLRHWNSGCQMVALNYQTADKHMRLNEAMFRLNSYTGYVPKPARLTNPAHGVPNTETAKIIKILPMHAMLVKPTYVQEVVDERWELSCTAEIVTDTLSGDVALVSCADATTMPALGSGDGKDRSSSRPSTDSSSGGSNIFGDILREKVKQRDNALTSICDLVGEASPHYTLGGSRPDSVVIMSEGSFSTSFKPLNGMTVIWEDESTTFIVPESQLAFIRFSICNSSGDTVATTTLSIEALKQGYRYIYLEFNRSGSNGKRSTEVPNVHVVSLFTHIEIMELHSTNHRCTCGKHIHHSRCHSRRASSVSSTSLSLTTTATKKT